MWPNPQFQKVAKHTLKISQDENHKMFKVCLAIFQNEAWNGLMD